MKIKTLNDNFRKSFIGGQVFMTVGISSMVAEDQANILNLVRNFNHFTKENDPYHEHDFGSFEYKGQTIFWKIDYYDLNGEYLSADPSDPSITNRILTIMLSDEY